MDKPIPVVEVFGPTIAGEGNIAGEQTLFLRTGYCDYRCSWCDSMHAVDPEQVKQNAEWLSPVAIVDRLLEQDLGSTPWVSLSGGNPVMHVGLGLVVEALHEEGYKVNVETQGSMWQDWLELCDVVTVSPKPPSSGMSDRRDDATLDRILVELDQSILKVVAFNRHDLAWAATLAGAYHEVPFYLSIGTEPDDTRDTLLDRYRDIADYLLEVRSPLNRAAILPQMHVLLWGHGQGV